MSTAAPTAPDPAHTFAAAAHSFSRDDAVLVALLAMAGTLNISRWCEQARYAGLRETPTRTFSTTTLRPLVESLVARGLARATPKGTFAFPPELRTVALRWATSRLGTAKQVDFDLLTRTAVPYYPDPIFDARIAIHQKRPDAVALLDTLHKEQPRSAGTLALEVNDPFDAAWFRSLPAPLAARLVELALTRLEQGAAHDGVYRAVAADLALLDAASDVAAAAFAGVAVLRGDLEVLRRLLARPVAARAPTLAPLIRAALAVVEGRYGDATAEATASPELKRTNHLGVLAALSAVALRYKSPASERAARLVALGARNGAPLQQTFRVFQSILVKGSEALATPVRFARDVEADALTALWMTLRVREEVTLDSYVAVQAVVDAMRGCKAFGAAGYAWVAEQCHLAAWALYALLNASTREFVPAAQVPPKPPKTAGPSLFGAEASQAPWERALDRLEVLAEKVVGTRAEATRVGAGARVLWRVVGAHHTLEPYLQKRGADGKWTAGRKLAIKHLLGKTETTLALPPEDLRVAAFAREEREVFRGYPSVYHFMAPEAWLALVGHPRVFRESSETPCPVVRGELRVSMTPRGADLTLAVDPPGLREGVNVREWGGELVVLQVDTRLTGILEAVGEGLTVPARGKDRLLALLDRLGSVVPVESSEPLRSKAVPADPRPLFHLVPNKGGLSVSLFVRPLGAFGPVVAPGRGAPTLLGHVDGETVQTARDLALELRLAADALAACPALVASETGTWFLADPPACLELVSTLRGLGDTITVEWPYGAPLRLRGRVGRRALRGKLRHTIGAFELEGSLAVDGDLSLEISQLLELLAEHPGRFVQLASGEYIELEQELREVLDGLAAARAPSTGPAVLVPPSAISVLDSLTQEGTGLALDERSADWRERFTLAFRKIPALPKRFDGTLRDYQLEGFRWLARLAELELGACLADDMGLGKTVQLIALLVHRLDRASAGPALVVAPTSVCEGWRRELARFAPSLAVRALWGPDRADALRGLGRREVVVTSYAILQQDAEALQRVEWGTVILDEAQLIKNPETLRAKAAFGLKARARVIATGTPVENHAGDLFSLFHFLNPGLLGTWKSFSARIAAGPAGASGAPGASGGSRAHRRLLQPFVLRRTKAQVLDDLPPITEIQRTVLLSPGEAKLYDSVREAAIAKLGAAASGSAQARVQIFAELTRLRRLCCHPQLVAPAANLTSAKLESFLELVRELVAGRHRVLVFSQFTDVLALVKPLLDASDITYQYLDGATSMKQRTAAVDAFQGGDDDVFLISLKAGGFGLNLTSADYVIHLDPWWNPAVESQATDRAHRIGQTRPVTVYRLVTAGTIEARIVELHREKRDLADALLEDTDRAAKLTERELRSLLEP